MKAMSAAQLIMGYCQALWPTDAVGMAKTVAPQMVGHVMDISGAGSHKYVPTEGLNKQLKQPDGAGVFGYARFDDGSYLLYCCYGLAVWAGEEDFSSAKMVQPLVAQPPLKFKSAPKQPE